MRQLEDRVWDISNFILQAYGLKSRHRGHGRKARSPFDSQAPERPEAQSASASGDSGSESADSTSDGDTGPAIPGSAAEPPASTPNLGDGHTNDKNSAGDNDDRGPADEHQDGQRGTSERETRHGGRKGGDERNPRKEGDPAGSLRTQAIRASKAFAFDLDRLSTCELVPIEIDARKRAHTLLDELLARKASASVEIITDPAAQASLEEADLLAFTLVDLWTNSTVKRTKSLQLSTRMDFSEEIPLAILMAKDGGGMDAVIRVRGH